MSDVVCGYLAGVPVIIQNLRCDPSAAWVTVELTQDYQVAVPGGFPARPPTGTAANEVIVPKTYPAGTVMSLFDFEAAALVAAGAATVVSTIYPGSVQAGKNNPDAT